MTVSELLIWAGGLSGLVAFVKVCWAVASAAINMQESVKQLTEAVKKLETSLDNGMVEVRTRLLALETKEAIRTATEHIHDMENR